MEESYLRVLLYRNTARATCASVVACPGATSTLEGALAAEAAIQQIIKVYWNEQEQVWNTELNNRCNLGMFVKASSFPDFPYPIVDPSLGLGGTEEMVVLFEPMNDLQLRIEERKLSSVATASRLEATDWSARWTE